MKKVIVLFPPSRKLIASLCAIGLCVAFATTTAFANLLVYEPFADATGSGGTSYTSGDPIIGQTPAVPGTPWNQAGTAGTGTLHHIYNSGLTGPAGFPASTGNAGDMVLPDYKEFARLDLPQTFYTGTTLYYSLLVNIPSIAGMNTPNSNNAANNDLLIGFNNTTGAGSRPSNWGGELVIRLGSAPNTYNLGVRATSSGSTTYWTGDLLDTANGGGTHLVVVRYTQGTDASTGTDDANDLWLDPSSGTFGNVIPPTQDGGTYGTINQANAAVNYAASLIIGNGITDTATVSNPNESLLDEIRVGTTWADVTAVPEPSTAVLAGLGMLGLILGYRNRRRQ